MESNAKRILASLMVVAMVIIGVIAIHVYPRRLIKDIAILVPSGENVAWLRASDLSPLWRGFSQTAFAREVHSGDIYPFTESEEWKIRLREIWEKADSSLAGEFFGRECILAIYSRSGGRISCAGIWSRVGFRARALHLMTRICEKACIWRPGWLLRRQEGNLTVTTVLDRRNGKPRFSYALIGDLGIATLGSGDEFWRKIADIEAGRAGAITLKGYCGGVEEGAISRGAIFIDAAWLRRYVDEALLPSGKRSVGELDWALDLWRFASGYLHGVEVVEGDFVLGKRAKGNIRLSLRSGSPSPRTVKFKLSRDPLANLMERVGIAYAAGRCDPGDALRTFCREKGLKEVEFARGDETVTFPADHFTLSWAGEECSLLLCQGEEGMLHAALSLTVADPDTARERMNRFARLMSGSRMKITNRRNKTVFQTAGDIEIKSGRRGDSQLWYFRPEGVLWRFYAPCIAFDGKRIIAATSDTLIFSAMEKEGEPVREWMAAASGRLVLKGGEMARVASAARQILFLAAPFVENQHERERLMAARRALALCEWFAAVREAWATASGGEGAMEVNLGARLTDIQPR